MFGHFTTLCMKGLSEIQMKVIICVKITILIYVMCMFTYMFMTSGRILDFKGSV